jgi:hypothetical protein
VREQLLPEIGSPTDAGNSPGARRGKQSLITTIRRYLDAGLAASLEARSADATRSRINATSSLDELLDLQDEPWVSPPVTAALAEVWEAVAGSGATEASPTMVAAIIDVTLPKLPFVVATEHTHGIKDALWRRFDEYNGTIEGEYPLRLAWQSMCHHVPQRIHHHHHGTINLPPMLCSPRKRQTYLPICTRCTIQATF